MRCDTSHLGQGNVWKRNSEGCFLPDVQIMIPNEHLGEGPNQIDSEILRLNLAAWGC